ncbi:hypothetical protein BJV78DRAFT_756240 [Lactifluus subvellereus]|nr:hypothetical protein BJV78DRAFT_756240 [Lactifluus subvellereus]
MSEELLEVGTIRHGGRRPATCLSFTGYTDHISAVMCSRMVSAFPTEPRPKQIIHAGFSIRKSRTILKKIVAPMFGCGAKMNRRVSFCISFRTRHNGGDRDTVTFIDVPPPRLLLASGPAAWGSKRPKKRQGDRQVSVRSLKIAEELQWKGHNHYHRDLRIIEQPSR